ncbi:MULTISPECIES: cation:proton antiporter regulatory subunit [unclassified Streptomyces]|uniref:cation:proton antiporter regulatory subunit n=1 Tax=unclassified Streptomyces TaxID=2593676 RepID=UPI000A9A16E7|nr:MULTISPECIES: TrkA C-terminal domain-containing protein [unclassified Streptomyces]AZM64592.1 potassium transporter TrkA [Streptomyces sp. WAC 01438]RSM97013.1 potassium transporter TrkA [Streptomyces sp. WAC 01420]
MPAPRLRTTPLPGIGVQYELTTRKQDTLSVIAHRDGTRTLNVHHDDDPDSCGLALQLTGAEALSLTDALLPHHNSPNLLHTSDFGLLAERVTITGTSRWNGRTLGETQMRTRTGASIVAVMRRAHAIPSPGPEFRLRGGDTVIVIGTREGVDGAHEILERT